MPQEITAITGRFAFCACAHNPAEGTNSLLQLAVWKANPEQQAALADEEKD